MPKDMTELAREVIERIDRGEPMDEAISVTLSGADIAAEARSALEAKGLRDAVVHEAFHELLEWHSGFGGLPEFLEIDDAIHQMAERLGHDMDQPPAEHRSESARRIVH